MIVVKTDELIGAALDWAVAKCEGFVQADDPPWEAGYEPFAYSTDWELAGPIIEREHISIEQKHDGWWTSSIKYNYQDDPKHLHLGENPLIAAMRCIVASKLGDTIEVPDELFQGEK